MHDAPLLTVGLVTDIHYAPAGYGNRDCPGALARLRVTLQIFEDACIPLVINLGDAVDDAPSVAAELTLCASVCAVFAAFPGTVLHAIGNHDVAMLSKTAFLTAIDNITPPYFRQDIGGVRVIVLDGNCHADGSDFDRGDFAWDDAWIAPAQVAWLAGELAAADRPVLLCCHECLDESTDDPHVVRNAAEIRQLIHDSGVVRGVFQGHYHAGRRRVMDGIPYITIPSVATGAGDEPVGAIVTLYHDGRIDVQTL
jgi:hypothetical protein